MIGCKNIKCTEIEHRNMYLTWVNQGDGFSYYKCDICGWIKPDIDAYDGCVCQECGRKYKLDIMVDDGLWKIITNKNLLCPNCIVKKIENIFGFNAYKLEHIE